MAEYNFLNYTNETGVMPLLYTVRDSVLYSFETILLSFLLVITIGSYYSVSSRTQNGKLAVSFASGCFSTLILSLFFILMDLISVSFLMLIINLNIIAMILLIFYKKEQ